MNSLSMVFGNKYCNAKCNLSGERLAGGLQSDHEVLNRKLLNSPDKKG